MFRKPSTAIAACIKMGIYVDPQGERASTVSSMYMCHALDGLYRLDEISEHTRETTVHLIEDELYRISPKSMMHGAITLDTVLRDIGEFGEDDIIPHSRRLKFWKEFIRDLKQKGL